MWVFISSWKWRLVSLTVFVIFITAGGYCLYDAYETRSIRCWNVNQKQTAFDRLRKNARCPAEEFQLGEEQSFLNIQEIPEKVYTSEKSSYSWGEENSKIRLLFEVKAKKKKTGKVIFNRSSIQVRSDIYATLFSGRPWKNPDGMILKITVSGWGRIVPYLYCMQDQHMVDGVPDRQINHSSCRIASFRPRDYYFSFQCDPKYTRFCVGIDMRGDLNITGISVICGRDRREGNIAVVAARVQEVSEIPDPQKSPYPDCLHTLKMKTLQIERGKSVPQEFVLAVPSFKNRKRAPESKWKKNDVIFLSMIRFQEESEAVRNIQLSDTLDEFDSERYSLVYSVQPRKIYLLDTGIMVNPSFGKKTKYISGYDRPQNSPLTGREIAARRQRIAVELNKMKQVMGTMQASPQELNRRFEAVWTKNRQLHRYKKIGESDVYWCRQGKSYFACESSHQFIAEKDISPVIRSIKELSDYLLVHGVSMIVVVCPYYKDISARMMNPGMENIPDYNAAGIAKQLLEQGVETMYISDEILAHARDYDIMFYYPFDLHPAYGTQQIVARMIARYLRKTFPEICRERYRREQFTEKPSPYHVRDIVLEKSRCLWDIWFPKGKPVYPEILLDDKPIRQDPGSPVMLYGNSFLYTPGSPEQKYLLSALTRELKMGVGVMYRTWIDPLTTMSLELLQKPEIYLKGRKVCIFYYSVSYFWQIKVWNIKDLDQIMRKNSQTQ